jgi:hypothetical protein
MLALKGGNLQGGKGYKDRVMLLLYCSSYGTEKCCTLIVLKFEKPHCLNGWSLNSCDYKSSKNAWVIGRLFRKCLIIFQQKMACWNRNVLQLKDQ